MADDLTALEDWLGDYLATLDPAPMRGLSIKIMREVRKANAKRIAANVQPDGTAMAPRKPDKRRTGRAFRIRNRSKMFRNIRRLRNMPITADADGGELTFKGGLSRIAAQHHFGLTVTFGKLKDGTRIRARMTQRRLLGFNDDDRAGILDAMAKHLDQD